MHFKNGLGKINFCGFSKPSAIEFPRAQSFSRLLLTIIIRNSLTLRKRAFIKNRTINSDSRFIKVPVNIKSAAIILPPVWN
jgi:hypothetical protein